MSNFKQKAEKRAAKEMKYRYDRDYYRSEDKASEDWRELKRDLYEDEERRYYG